MVADAAGDLIVSAATSAPHTHGLIRSNAGGTWHIIEDFCAPSGNARVESLAIDPSGRIYASCRLEIDGSVYRVVRSGPLITTHTKNQVATNTITRYARSFKANS